MLCSTSWSLSILSIGYFPRFGLFSSSQQCLKYCNFNYFTVAEILWKCTVSPELWAIYLKSYGNCVFSQNFHTRKLGKVSVFYVV